MSLPVPPSSSRRGWLFFFLRRETIPRLRAARSEAEWCAADPGSKNGPRVCGAPLRAAPRPGNASRHAFHRAPALERAPDRAFEAEAVDRRGAGERADAGEPDPGPLEAALLQHP